MVLQHLLNGFCFLWVGIKDLKLGPSPAEDVQRSLGLQHTYGVKFRQGLPKIQPGKAQKPHTGHQHRPDIIARLYSTRKTSLQMLMSSGVKRGYSLSHGITPHRWRPLASWHSSTDASAYSGMIITLSPSPCPENLLSWALQSLNLTSTS